jgi:hypothetical protein
MRLVDEARKPLREPVVPTRLAKITAHSLLNDDPLAVVRHDEAVEVESEAVLNRSTVNFGNEAARAREVRAMTARTALKPMLQS